MGTFQDAPICRSVRDRRDASWNQTQAFVNAELLACVEQHLHSDADSQERASGCSEGTHRRVETLPT
jgi:hypothetical protein